MQDSIPQNLDPNPIRFMLQYCYGQIQSTYFSTHAC